MKRNTNIISLPSFKNNGDKKISYLGGFCSLNTREIKFLRLQEMAENSWFPLCYFDYLVDTLSLWIMVVAAAPQFSWEESVCSSLCRGSCSQKRLVLPNLLVGLCKKTNASETYAEEFLCYYFKDNLAAKYLLHDEKQHILGRRIYSLP